MRTLIVCAALVGLAGCTQATKMYGPDGNQYTRISCDGAAVPMSACYDRALTECPQGYFLADERMNNMGGVAAFNAAANPYQATAYGFGGPILYKSIIVRCK